MAYKAKRRKDRKIFRTTANKTTKINQTGSLPRGGIRL